MFWKILSLFALCTAMSAAELPDGWKFYHSLSPKAPADAVKGTVTVEGDAIRIVDPGANVETGLRKDLPCTPGEYYRITVDIKNPGKEMYSKMSVSAYYTPRVVKEAVSRMLKPGAPQVVTFGPVPEGVKKVTVFVYSRRPTACNALITVPKLEVSKTPFETK